MTLREGMCGIGVLNSQSGRKATHLLLLLVCISAVVHYSPSLASLSARILESIRLAVDEVNSLPGLQVLPSGVAGGTRGIDRDSGGADLMSSPHPTAGSLPFRVEVGLKMQPVLEPECGALKAALAGAQVTRDGGELGSKLYLPLENS